MRWVMEVTVFVAIAALAVAVMFLLAMALGSRFEIRQSQAIFIAVVAVAFWLPAAANVHIAIGARGGGQRLSRVCAGSRAFGMLLCSAAVGAGFFFSDVSLGVLMTGFIAGMIMNFGTLYFEQ